MTGREEPPVDTRDARPKSFDDFELTLGDIMRGERATMGKSLLEVQRDIKIKAEYLAAIEDADLSSFETPGFIAGYVKSYARYLGMNPDWAYRRFCDESGFSHVAGLDAQIYTTKRKPRTAAPARPGRRGRSEDPGDARLARNPIYAATAVRPLAGIQPGAVGSLAVLACLIAGLGYGGFRALEEIQRVRVTPVDTALSTGAPQAGGTAGDPLVASNAAPTAEALERLYRPRSLDRPILTPRDAPIATLDPGAQGVFAEYAPAPEIAAPPPVRQTPETPTEPRQTAHAAPPPPAVVLFARDPSWVRVRAAGGEVLYEGILQPGDSYVLPDTDEPPTLRAGNSGSLFFAVNGTPHGPAGVGASIASDVVLTPAALTAAYSPVVPDADSEMARLVALLAPEQAEQSPVRDPHAAPEVQVVEAPPPEIVLFARRPAWVRVSAADGTVLLEKILEPGDRYVLPDTAEPPILRAGNSGSLFFAVNGQPIGPAGSGTSVAKNVELSADSLMTSYSAADLGEDPELARLAELVLTAATDSPTTGGQ